MKKTFNTKDIVRYIEAVNKDAAEEWINGFSQNRQLQNSYFWILFTEIYVKQKRNINVTMTAGERVLPLSASQARRTIDLAVKDGYVSKKKEGVFIHLTLTKKTELIVESTCSKALASLEYVFIKK